MKSGSCWKISPALSADRPVDTRMISFNARAMKADIAYLSFSGEKLDHRDAFQTVEYPLPAPDSYWDKQLRVGQCVIHRGEVVFGKMLMVKAGPATTEAAVEPFIQSPSPDVVQAPDIEYRAHTETVSKRAPALRSATENSPEDTTFEQLTDVNANQRGQHIEHSRDRKPVSERRARGELGISKSQLVATKESNPTQRPLGDSRSTGDVSVAPFLELKSRQPRNPLSVAHLRFGKPGPTKAGPHSD